MREGRDGHAYMLLLFLGSVSVLCCCSEWQETVGKEARGEESSRPYGSEVPRKSFRGTWFTPLSASIALPSDSCPLPCLLRL